MPNYRITGIWRDDNKVITHYAIHTPTDTGLTRAQKVSKEDAIKLLGTPGNTATTRMWDYVKMGWSGGEKVEVVNGSTGKYLRSNPDNKLTDNLGHLIDFDWILP